MLLWTLLYAVLVVEALLVLILCLPVPSSSFRQAVVSVYRVMWIKSHYVRYFVVTVILIQLLCFLDAIRTINHLDNHHSEGALADLMDRNRLLRNQRNMYITGFGLFLVLVGLRFLQLMDQLVTSRASQKAAEKAAHKME
eukprot:NODE_6060_length_577_cov_26.031111_g5895_i0.p1 GENE.NODE_6060_length_577_cov_26.031111_g5895_i0~~NODE_6060_length_577_cov_26.031111_g5895_i0.p1  ORF type:complete len:159 (+),score=29.20 NODE_6060_length_577_cov_26.031111_g5895_i0:59-478(+)